MHKYNIVLDLDHTLLSSEEIDELKLSKWGNKSEKFKFLNMDGYYLVYLRPGVQKFLDYIFKNFNVSVWTAASKEYALWIVKEIILPTCRSGRKLDWVFFDYHCEKSIQTFDGSKDLRMLWDIYKIPQFNQQNTFIIDDYDEVFRTQPKNCIISPGFHLKNKGSEDDSFLIDLIEYLDVIKSGKTITVIHGINNKFSRNAAIRALKKNKSEKARRRTRHRIAY